MGDTQACARDAEDRLTCWGDPWTTGPDQSPPEEQVLDFSLENNHNVAVLPDGTLDVWGNTESPWNGHFPPVGVPLAQVSTGRKSACGLDAAGTAYCWGEHDDILAPQLPAGAYAAIDTWDLVSCGIGVDAGLDCVWFPIVEPYQTWLDAYPRVPMAQVGLGEFGGCGASLAGEGFCWGDDPARSWMQVPAL